MGRRCRTVPLEEARLGDAQGHSVSLFTETFLKSLSTSPFRSGWRVSLHRIVYYGKLDLPSCDCDTSIASPGRFLPSSGTLLCLYSVQRKHLVGQPLRSPSRLLPDRVDEGTHLTVFVWVLHHPENLARPISSHFSHFRSIT